MKNKKETEIEKNNFLSSLPVCVFEVSKDRRIKNICKKFSQFFGYEDNEVIGNTFKSVLKIEQKKELENIFDKLEAGESVENQELIFKTKNNKDKKFLVNAEKIQGREKGEDHFVFVLIDIVGLEEVEKEKANHLYFLESMDKLNSAIQGNVDIKKMLSDALNVVLDILKCDRAFLFYPCDIDAKFWSVPMIVTRPEYPGLSPDEKIPVTPRTKKITETVLSMNEPLVFDSSTVKGWEEESEKAGVRAQMIFALYPKMSKPWSLGIHQCSYDRIWSREDINLFKEIGYRLTDALTILIFFEELKKSEGKFKTLLENAPIVIIQLDSEHKIVAFNKEAENLYGKKKEDVVGKNYFELFLPEKEWGGVKKEIEENLGGKVTKGYENDVVDSFGNVHKMSWDASRFLDSENKPAGIIAVGLDITERRKTEEKLHEKIEDLKKVNEIMIDRELKMIELKKLLKESGK